MTRMQNILARVREYQAPAKMWSNGDPPSLLGEVPLGGSVVSGETEMPALLEKFTRVYT